MLKALVIQGRFSDLREVLAIAVAEGKRAFHTKQRIEVVDLIGPRKYLMVQDEVFIAIVHCGEVQQGS